MIIDRAEALHHLRPNSIWSLQANVLNWQDSKQTKPTEAEIDAEIIRLQAEYDAQEYARNRASAYDSVGDQLDQLMQDMRDGTTTHQTACEAVKAKYPKPEKRAKVSDTTLKIRTTTPILQGT